MVCSSALFRCNAGHAEGYGHVSRCLALAMELREKGVTSVFLLQSSEAAERVRQRGFSPLILKEQDEGQAFANEVRRLKPDLLVLDVRPPYLPALLQEIRRYVGRVALLDDCSEQRYAADAIYLPPVPRVVKMDWSDCKARLRVGLEWMLTGDSFSPPSYRQASAPYRLLLTMGGSDPWSYTKRLAPVFAGLCLSMGLEMGVTVGPGFVKRQELIQSLRLLPGMTRIFDAPPDMGKVYGWCDMALAPMCVSAYELAMSAKAALYICPDDDYREHARVFVDSGLGAILNMPDPALPEEEKRRYFTEVLKAFTADFIRPGGIERKSRELFPSPPAAAIATDILEMF